MQVKSWLQPNLTHDVCEQRQAWIDLLGAGNRLATTKGAARLVLERGDIQRRLDTPPGLGVHGGGDFEGFVLRTAGPQCRHERRGDGAVGALRAQATQDLNGVVFASSAQQANRLGQRRLGQLPGQLDERAADGLVVGVELPGAGPVVSGGFVVAALLVPDGLADMSEGIFGVVGGTALERRQRRVVLQLELRPGQDPQRGQAGRLPLQDPFGERRRSG